LSTMADCEMKLGQPASALRHYEKASGLGPQDSTLHLLPGHCYLRLHNAPGADRAYRQAILHAPDRAEGYYALGFSQFRQGQVRESLVQYRRAVQCDASNPLVHVLMGCAYRRLGDEAAAREAFKRALALDPRYDLARAYLAAPNRAGPRFH